MENFINLIADFLLAIYPAVYILALFCGVVFVASGFTDLFFDLYFIAYSIRRFIVGRKWQPLTLERMEAREQQRIAIFIAAWKEADVIANTLTHACEAIRYRNYDIFVGTYPNDAATQSEVDKVAEKYERIHKVVVPENGPTNKASNLNHVFNALQKYESQTHQFYDIIVIHDSEDIIHPYSLLVYNYLIPRMDMVQIPVFPLALPLRKVTHWTYADEFAENHTKLLRVRELMGGFVPSAGVGTAFTKRSFQMLALQDFQEIFPTDTLTEDYQLGLQLNLNQMKSAFVQVRIKNPETQAGQKEPYLEWVATQAVFPTDFKRAVRQKTRWNIGIIFQGWKNIGWRVPLAVKWNLLNDRKALIAAPVNFLAYLVFIYFLLYAGVANLSSNSMPALIFRGSLLWYLMILSAIFMLWRAINRAYAVNKIYGWLPALTSVPRIIWGNLINFLAVIRALYFYISSRLQHRQVAWDKTAHEFPVEISAVRKTAPVHTSSSHQSIEIFYSGKNKDEVMHAFQHEIEEANDQKRIKLLQSIPREYGELLFPFFISYIKDPSWEVRAAVCRTLSFLRLPQSLPYLIQAACDADWVVRSNAVRAIGKLGDEGEEALLHLLGGNDRYAREAALAVLEQQGFLQHHLEQIKRADNQNYQKSLRFFEILAEAGGSKLAKEILAENKKRIKCKKRRELRLLLQKKRQPQKNQVYSQINKNKLYLLLRKKASLPKISAASPDNNKQDKHEEIT